MIFDRDRTFYFATVFIPGLMLVTSSFVTFFLDWDAVPARTIIGVIARGLVSHPALARLLNVRTRSFSGVTTMSNYFTTFNGFRRTLPDVANLTAMNVWDGVCMCFVFASFVEFVVVNSTGRTGAESTGPRDARNAGVVDTKVGGTRDDSLARTAVK